MNETPAPASIGEPATPEELVSYGLWGRVRRMRLMERASTSFHPTGMELEKVWQEFCRRNGVDPVSAEPVPLAFEGAPPGLLKNLVSRRAGLAAWKEATFGAAAKRLFLDRKHALDRVVYSIVRVRDQGLARELWFRLGEGEASFAELVALHPAGEEVHTGGVVGPVPISRVHPDLAGILASAKAGELLGPKEVGGWFVVVRLERKVPAVYDPAVKAALVEELVEAWIRKQEDGHGGKP